MDGITEKTDIYVIWKAYSNKFTAWIIIDFTTMRSFWEV